DVRDRPVLVQGSGDEVYLVDDPLPGEGTGVGGAGGSTGGSAWGSGGSAGSAPWDGSAGDDAGGAAGAGGEGAAANGIQTRVIGSGPEGCACRSVGAAPADASGLGGLSLLLGVG